MLIAAYTNDADQGREEPVDLDAVGDSGAMTRNVTTWSTSTRTAEQQQRDRRDEGQQDHGPDDGVEQRHEDDRDRRRRRARPIVMPGRIPAVSQQRRPSTTNRVIDEALEQRPRVRPATSTGSRTWVA